MKLTKGLKKGSCRFYYALGGMKIIMKINTGKITEWSKKNVICNVPSRSVWDGSRVAMECYPNRIIESETKLIIE